MITTQDVENIALLARLEIQQEEINAYQNELSKILDFVDKIKQLNLQSIEPTSHILNIQNIFREDTTKNSFEREKVLQNAPQQKDGFIVVPKVI